MININNQEVLFNEIGRALPRKLIVYSIGGTAMMLFGLKEETKDIDVVFDNESDRKLFVKTLEGMNFKKDERIVIEQYGLKKNTPEIFRLGSGDFMFDLFLNKIVSSVFSEGMKKRARQTHEFGINFIMKAADPHDILIMKSVTSRAKDIEDIISIINKTKIDWNILVSEAEEQVRLGNETAVLGLGEKLEEIANKKIALIPKDVLDRLWKLLSKQVKGKKNVNKSGKG